MVFCGFNLYQFGQINSGFKAVNTEGMWDMVGYSFYCFEGIGTLLPVMHESENKFKFNGILKTSLIFLCVFFTSFGFIAYAWFGS